MEHWLPLFHERLETLFDYLPDAVVTFDALDDDARGEAPRAGRGSLRGARAGARAQGLRRAALQSRAAREHVPHRGRLASGAARAAERSCSIPSSIQTPRAMPPWSPSAAGRGAPSPPSASAKAATCSMPSSRTPHASKARASACSSAAGARAPSERLATLLAEHGIGDTLRVETWHEVLAAPQSARPPSPCCRSRPASRRQASPSSASRTFSATGWCAARAARRGSDVLTEVSSLAVGDLVVHADHGIGRFVGLATIEAAGEPHDCLEVDLCRAATSSICPSRTSRC